MIKLTWKNFIVSTVTLVAIVVGISFVDNNNSQGVTVGTGTALKVYVVDSDGKPLHNAVVNVGEMSFYTDNMGYSPSIDIPQTPNIYDNSISNWFTVNVTVSKGGYITTIVVQCVLNTNSTRQLTIHMIAEDSTSPPYVCYVESPPDSYLMSLLNNQ